MRRRDFVAFFGSAALATANALPANYSNRDFTAAVAPIGLSQPDFVHKSNVLTA